MPQLTRTRKAETTVIDIKYVIYNVVYRPNGRVKTMQKKFVFVLFALSKVQQCPRHLC